MKTSNLFLAVLLSFISSAQAGTWTTLDMPGASHTSVFGISGNSIVGYYVVGSNKYGYLYNGTIWTPLNYPGANLTQANGISGNIVAGFYDDSSGEHAFLYDGASYTSLTYPGATTGTWAGSISGSNVVGAYGDSDGNGHAFFYDGTSWITLDCPWADYSPSGKKVTEAYGISGSNIVGAYTDNAYNAHGFLYNGTSWTSLDYPGAIQTWAVGISGNSIVGAYADSSGNAHGFLYDAYTGGTWTALNYPGAKNTTAYGIEGSSIVGAYVDSSGNEHGFLYTIPEPCAIALLTLGSLALVRRRKSLPVLLCLVACGVLAKSASADTFGTGANQFSIEYVNISGTSNPTSGIVIDDGFTFTGVVNDYRMGRYEITNEQWNKFKNCLGVPITGSPSSAYDEDQYFMGINMPANRVSWYEAAQFVNWLNTNTGHQPAYKFTGTQGTSDYTLGVWDAEDAWGGTNLSRNKDAFYFLPTDDEWVKAAYWNGTSLQIYSTKPGDSLYQGNGINGGWNYGFNPNVSGVGLWNVGSGSEELNGTYDMMGNAWEWTESPYDSGNVEAGPNRDIRGGAYDMPNYFISYFGRSENPPYGEWNPVGFRVASVPEPCILALLSLGGLALVRRRKAYFNCDAKVGRKSRALSRNLLTIFVIWGLTYATAWGEDYNLAWTRQIGTEVADHGRGIATDDLGNIFISGTTWGDLEGTNHGDGDAFLARYDTNGNCIWTRQFGSLVNDFGYAVSADGLGNVFIAGATFGSISSANQGHDDAYLAKYDINGNLLWNRQMGSRSQDLCFSITADKQGSVFISGVTGGSLAGELQGNYDAFLMRYDTNGNLIWNRQLGTQGSDGSVSVAADGQGNVFLAGDTSGSLNGENAGGQDAFIANYGYDGSFQWVKQFGTSKDDMSASIITDGLGNVYVSGRINGSIVGGSFDSFLAKIDKAGNLAWLQQLGTSGNDESRGVAIDSRGNISICGYTDGSLGGDHIRGYDAFLAQYDPLGNLLWTKQFGTDGEDYAGNIVADRYGNLYGVGLTTGSLVGSNLGDVDAFVLKYEVPEPTVLCLLTFGGIFLRKRKGN